MKTAVLIKDGITAFVGYRPCCDCGRFMLVKLDPRDGVAEMSQQDDEAIAEKNFNGSVAKSARRGWRVIHCGAPNQG